MTHDHSALLEQLTELGTLRSDELGLAGVLPEILRAGLQALIEAEATAAMIVPLGVVDFGSGVESRVLINESL